MDIKILNKSKTFDNISEFGLTASWILVDCATHNLIGESTHQVVSKLNTEQILKLF